MSPRSFATPYRRKPRTYCCFLTTLPSARAIFRSACSEGDAQKKLPTMPRRNVVAFVLMLAAPAAGFAQAGPGSRADAAATLIRAYPDFLDRSEENDLVWKDGTRMRIDDGKGAKTFDALLDDP